MKINKYMAFGLILFSSSITTTYAACTQEEINTFRKIEDDYKITYQIDKETKKYTLLLERSNPEMYEYVFIGDYDIKCEDVNSTLAKCSSFSPGEYQIVIAGQTESCNNVLKKITLTLPKYNILSEDPLCEGIEEFVLCNPTYDKEIDYDTFVSRVNTYKRTKENQTETEEPEETKKNEFIDETLEYIKDNLLQIIVVAVFIILVIITIILTAKSIRKSRRLE